jgi:hypothetical protein
LNEYSKWCIWKNSKILARRVAVDKITPVHRFSVQSAGLAQWLQLRFKIFLRRGPLLLWFFLRRAQDIFRGVQHRFSFSALRSSWLLKIIFQLGGFRKFFLGAAHFKIRLLKLRFLGSGSKYFSDTVQFLNTVSDGGSPH